MVLKHIYIISKYVNISIKTAYVCAQGSTKKRVQQSSKDTLAHICLIFIGLTIIMHKESTWTEMTTKPIATLYIINRLARAKLTAVLT